MHLARIQSVFSFIVLVSCADYTETRLNSLTARSYCCLQGIKNVQNHERRSRLIDLIRIQGFAALEELVRELGVSE